MKATDRTRREIVDPRESPRYSLVEAANYLRLPVATLSSWVRGRSYPVSRGARRSEPLIVRPLDDDTRLAFSNLIEAFVLRALREAYRIEMGAVRSALTHAERKYGVKRLFLSKELRAAPGQVFLDRYTHLIELSSPGQHAIRDVLAPYLERIEYDGGLALRLYPLVRRAGVSGPRTVAIDPRVAFGRPIVERRGIKTAMIAERFDVGESVSAIANDYDLEIPDVEEAIRYERWSEKAA
jgi:uncharacterized protein (DUF433 family)